MRVWAWAEVPATCANLGPGFDCLALALAGPGLRLRLEAEPADPAAWRCGPGEARWELEGEAAGEPLPPPADNGVVRAVEAACAAAGCPQPRRWRARIRSTIPPQRGLGSSAAATVAGLLAAAAWLRLRGVVLSREHLLALAARLEGHADNAAAALCGGVAVCWPDPAGGWRATSFRPRGALRAVVAVPAQRGATPEARALLPGSVPRQDAVFNHARTALLALALARGVPELLRDAMDDRLHQPYRLALYPWAARVMAAAVAAGARGACLSGAGPSVLALAEPGPAPAVAAAMAAALASAGVPGEVGTWAIAAGGARAGLVVAGRAAGAVPARLAGARAGTLRERGRPAAPRAGAGGGMDR